MILHCAFPIKRSMAAAAPPPAPPDSLNRHRPAAARTPLPADGGTTWPPFREPLGTTLIRTGVLALMIGAALAPYRDGL